MRHSRYLLGGLLFLLVAAVMCSGSEAAQDRRRPVKIEGKDVLPLRVLARPFSHIYQAPEANAATIQENVPALQSFYVYTRPAPEDREAEQGWYEVGSDNRGTVVGWMRTQDVFEWKQTMCLTYTHPEGRHPVLMFASQKPLLDVLQAPPEERTTRVQDYYAAIDAGQIAPDFPVKSIEPRKAVDIDTQFYLLPILEHRAIEIENREGRLLQLVAVTRAEAEARRKSDIREDREFLQQATTGSTEAAQEVLQKLTVDVVFVMDTTVSMRPYIAKTLEVIRNVASEITADHTLAESIRFGIWGYRDSVNDIPGIGYTTHNYTPDLQFVAQFVDTLATVEVTEVDSKDFPEDVFSGVADALSKTAWTPQAIRLIVLVGDAPGHELGHDWNLSGHSQETLRAIADDQSTYIFALHVKGSRGEKYHQTAEEQFLVLGHNPGMGGQSAFSSIAADDVEEYGRATGELTGALRDLVASARQGQVAEVHGMPPAPSAGGLGTLDAGPTMPALAQPDTAPQAAAEQSETTRQPAMEQSEVAQPPAGTDTRSLASRMFRAALVQWIGSQTGAMAPRDIVAWATDKDLIDPAVQAMEVRLLINKRQLDSLTTVLNDVMAAGRRGQIGGEDFFSALQATAATAARDPNQIANARSMAQTGLIPEFLLGLPYRSRLMDMTNDLWFSWSVDEQDEFLNGLEAKIQAYRAIHDRPEGWIALNQDDDPDEYVYPMNLELLP